MQVKIQGSELTKHLINHSSDSKAENEVARNLTTHKPIRNGTFTNHEPVKEFRYLDSSKITLNVDSQYIKDTTDLGKAITVVDHYLQQGYKLDIETVDQVDNCYLDLDPETGKVIKSETMPPFTFTPYVYRPLSRSQEYLTHRKNYLKRAGYNDKEIDAIVNHGASPLDMVQADKRPIRIKQAYEPGYIEELNASFDCLSDLYIWLSQQMPKVLERK